MTPNAVPIVPWTLRYAPHLGYAPPFTPLFRATVGDDDVSRHVAFAAAQGFAGVVSPWIIEKSDDEQRAFGDALRAAGLEAGCVVYAPLADALRPVWVGGDRQERTDLIGQVGAACSLAAGLGSNTVALLIAADADVARPVQIANLRDNLRFAADAAAAAGVTLGIEPMIALPGMLFQSTYDAADVIAAVDHPSLRLIFDTGHVGEMDGDVLGAQDALTDLICLYQFADLPGRVEPGAGTLDFVEIVRRLHAGGYDGLVELEHGWVGDGLSAEARGLARLRAIEMANKGESREAAASADPSDL